MMRYLLLLIQLTGPFVLISDTSTSTKRDVLTVLDATGAIDLRVQYVLQR